MKTDDMENERNPFIGTWENEHNGYCTVFTDNQITVYYPDKNIYWAGLYTYNDTEIRSKLNIEISVQEMINAAINENFITKYRFENDRLVLNGNPHIKISN